MSYVIQVVHRLYIRIVCVYIRLQVICRLRIGIRLQTTKLQTSNLVTKELRCFFGHGSGMMSAPKK